MSVKLDCFLFDEQLWIWSMTKADEVVKATRSLSATCGREQSDTQLLY